MAKIRFGPIVSEARNKQGNVVFSRSSSGAYTRAWVEPDQTPTPRRTTVQEIFTEVCDRWNTALSDSQRHAWHAWAQTGVESTRPIEPRTLSGRTAFVRINQRLGLYGASYLDEPPWEQNVVQLTDLELAADADAQTATLTFAPDAVPAGHAMVIFCTQALSLGRMFSADEQKFVLYLPDGETSPADISAEWIARYGAIPPDKKIFVRARLLNLANGAYSVNQIASAEVTGTGETMQIQRTVITPAQIKDLVANPVIVAPAPGAGKSILPIAYYIRVNFNTTPYVNAGAWAGCFFMADPSEGTEISEQIQQTFFITATESIVDIRPLTRNDDTDAFMVNAPIYLGVASGTDLTVGDSDWDVSVAYAIVDA